MDNIKQIQDWFASHCDGEWEHRYGVKIETLDNPGWSLEIDLVGTNKDGCPLDKYEVDRATNNWMHARVENNIFMAACGLQNLDEALEFFLNWAKEKECVE